MAKPADFRGSNKIHNVLISKNGVVLSIAPYFQFTFHSDTSLNFPYIRSY